MMELPNEMEKQFSEQLHQFEQKKHMPQVTSVERLAREQGIEQGIHAGVAQRGLRPQPKGRARCLREGEAPAEPDRDRYRARGMVV